MSAEPKSPTAWPRALHPALSKRGRRVTTVPKCRAEVEAAGATYVDAPSVEDGSLVTGRTYHDSGPFVGAWIRMLKNARG